MKHRMISILTALSLLLALLSGCSFGPTPAEAFFALMEEEGGMKQEYTLDADLAAEDTSLGLKLDLDLTTGEELQAVLTGKAGIDNVYSDIPRTTLAGGQLYLSYEDLRPILALLQMDYKVDCDAVKLEADLSALDTEPTEEDQALKDKIKSELMSHEELFAASEEVEGTYTLTLDETTFLSLAALTVEGMDREALFNAFMTGFEEGAAEAGGMAVLEQYGLGREDLEDAFHEVLDQLAAPDEEMLEALDLSAVITAGKTEDGVREITALISVGWEDSFSMTIETEAVHSPESEPLDPAIPENPMDLDEFIAALQTAAAEEAIRLANAELAAQEVEYYTGLVEGMNLTELGNGVATIDLLTYEGDVITMPVFDDIDWAKEAISAGNCTEFSATDDTTYMIRCYALEGIPYLQSAAESYVEYINGETGKDSIQIVRQVSQGHCDAIGMSGDFYGTQLDVIYAYVISDYSLEQPYDSAYCNTAVLEIFLFDQPVEKVTPLMDHLGIENPLIPAE